MELVTRTPLGAQFMNTDMGGNALLGCVIARPTFRIDGRELVPTPEEPWPIGREPVETAHGDFPGDVPFLLGGIDFFLVGRAYPPEGRPAARLRVDIQVGSRFARAIEVIGDRCWERQGDALVASDPEPFESMALTYANAYGGKVKLDEGEYTFMANPQGKGIYFSPEQAEGGPLPNLEDPGALISRFEDQPEPVGTAPYPADGALRALNSLDLELDDADPRITRLKPLCFNGAHPKMVLEPSDTPQPGESVLATHLRPGGDLCFEMPDLQLHVHVQLGERHSLFPLHLDQIAILAEEGRVFLSYRAVFKYRLVKRERRRATLHPGPVPASLPESYVNDWKD